MLVERVVCVCRTLEVLRKRCKGGCATLLVGAFLGFLEGDLESGQFGLFRLVFFNPLFFF